MGGVLHLHSKKEARHSIKQSQAKEPKNSLLAEGTDERCPNLREENLNNWMGEEGKKIKKHVPG